MKNKPTPSRTLGPVSADFVNELQRQGKTIFTTSDAGKLYGKDPYATGDFLSELVKRGILGRIKSGVYLILQTGSQNTQLTNWPVIARELAASDPYFISHYSAMRIHGMTSHPLFDIYLTVSKRKQDKKVRDITYHFIYSKPEHCWGGVAHWVTKQDQVQVSDIERTLLDGFDRPELSGGLTEVIRGLWAKQKEIDPKKLTRYAQKFRTKAAAKRLGFILETFNLMPECATLIFKHIAEAKDYVVLNPEGPKEGKHLRRWRLQLNTNLEELKASVWG